MINSASNELIWEQLSSICIFGTGITTDWALMRRKSCTSWSPVTKFLRPNRSGSPRIFPWSQIHEKCFWRRILQSKLRCENIRILSQLWVRASSDLRFFRNSDSRMVPKLTEKLIWGRNKKKCFWRRIFQAILWWENIRILTQLRDRASSKTRYSCQKIAGLIWYQQNPFNNYYQFWLSAFYLRPDQRRLRRFRNRKK